MRKDILEKIDELYKKHQSYNPHIICKELDLPVFYFDLGNTKGFFHKLSETPVIFINENLHEKEQMFVCAHELAHVLFHSDSNVYQNSNFINTINEREANYFALKLLLKWINIEESLDTTITYEHISMMTGVPLQYINCWL